MSSYLESLADNIRIDKDKCTFCGRCVERCILDNMRMKLAPCRQACPMGVNVQGYVQLILRGKEQAARELVREKLPFPEVVCMVCDHPCESACQRGKEGDQAVGIRALKRYLFDSPENTPYHPEKAPTTEHQIAIIGAGPAGLVAAYDLALKGHVVTVFEADDAPGGMLKHGIPAFRLPAETVRRELSVLSELGVVFSCNTCVGKDVALATVLRDFDAVVLACGLAGVKKLGIEGETTSGVHEGIAFLRDIRSGRGPALFGSVAVIGGGNVAVDTALAALRQGADKVFLISLEQEDALPAFANEIRQAQVEGVSFEAGWGPLRILENGGRVSGLQLRKCVQVLDAEGRFHPIFAAETRQLGVEHVIVAIGQSRDTHLLEGSGIRAEELTMVDPLTLQCGEANMFVAGEFHSGPSSVIKSMAQGRKAAESAHRLVMGEDLVFNRAYPGPVLTEFTIDTARGSDKAHVEPILRLPSGKGDYTVVERVLTPEEAQSEASRCYSCGGPCGHHRTCWFCLPCEVDCPEKALYVEIPYLLR